jgi:transposase
MYRKKSVRQESMFIVGRLSDFIPDDHILVKVKKVLELSWLDDVVNDCYHETQGRPCIETEKALRLMLCGFLHGIVHDRKLMREAQVNIASPLL